MTIRKPIMNVAITNMMTTTNIAMTMIMTTKGTP